MSDDKHLTFTFNPKSNTEVSDVFLNKDILTKSATESGKVIYSSSYASSFFSSVLKVKKEKAK